MRQDNRTFCGGCDAELALAADVFLCAKCLRSLPDDIRRWVFRAGGDEARAARSEALRVLGQSVTERRLAIPREPRPPKADCGHRAYKFQQASILGGDDEVCDECGHVRRVS